MQSAAVAFASTAYTQARDRQQIQQTFREYSASPFEAVVHALKKSKTMIVKIKGNWKVWGAPYVFRVRNSVISGSGFTENNYGLLFGFSHYLPRINANISAFMGLGIAKATQDAKANSKNNGKNLILGLTLSKLWRRGIEVISSLMAIGTRNTQTRQGNPGPSQQYLARAQYNSGVLSWQNEFGYIYKLRGGYSLRPCVGVQVLTMYRQRFTETNAGIFAQSYRSKINYSGEVYAGLGFRQKWESDKLEGKITLSYDIGRGSGNGKSNVMVYTNSAPQGVNFTGKTPGLMVHYFNIYGSVLNKKKNWKITPGCSVIYQKGQSSLSGTIGFEYRW
jgi:hypothetical protein